MTDTEAPHLKSTQMSTFADVEMDHSPLLATLCFHILVTKSAKKSKMMHRNQQGISPKALTKRRLIR